MVTFVLDTPIAPFQRKSYASENRWLKPNPIIIFAKPSPTDTSFSGKVRIILARDPRPGDDKTSQLVIDGKTFTLLNKQDILVTTKPEVPISSKFVFTLLYSESIFHPFDFFFGIQKSCCKTPS